jgi:23S rRNA pseudouridine1911/1915/1917 synthase
VLGDTMYGRRDGFTRLALHAKTLGFVHPHSGKTVRFEAAVPREFDLQL